MNIFRSMDISASALTVQRFRMDIIGENLANATNTRTAEGGPYRRKHVRVEERKVAPNSFAGHLQRVLGGAPTTAMLGGARVVKVGEDPEHINPMRRVYDPAHPDADIDGYVLYPNVDIEKEMTDALVANRVYEANITMLNNFKSMALRALDVGKG